MFFEYGITWQGWPICGKRGREGQEGYAYQLGGFSFDDKLLLLQILKREVLSACAYPGKELKASEVGGDVP
jgi:hypothetical protein